MIYPYTWREPSDCTPPRDVLDILGAPGHVTQARIIIFAANQQAAHYYLDRLDIAPRSPRALGPAHGEDVRALIAAGCNKAGMAFAIRNRAVAVIQLLGDVESTGRGRRVFRLEDPLTPTNALPEPEVTEAMLGAAYAALDAHDLDDLPGNAMRALIVAVLRAQREGQQ